MLFINVHLLKKTRHFNRHYPNPAAFSLIHGTSGLPVLLFV
jgi:hypothetical protein